MTKSNTSPQEPNAPIFLEDILITHINGHCLEKPCEARVVLRLSPTVMLLIESDSFPIGILDSGIEMPFVVTVKDKTDIQVVRGSLSMPGSSNRKTKGFLRLYKSPSIVIRSDERIKSVSFSVLNSKFYGYHDISGVSIELAHEKLKISLTQAENFSEHEKFLKHTGGYGVTHSGVIERSDGEIFSVEEAEHILHGLRAFLSFAQGARCGLTLVKAAYPGGGQAFLEWGSSHVDPWGYEHNTWLPMANRGWNLSQAFSGFWALYDDTAWREILLTAINWYINSKSVPFQVGIILIQAALESLCCKISGEKKGHTGEFLSKSIKEIGFCTAIPSSCGNLNAFFQYCSHVDGDGLKVITKIRNDLVHAKRKHDVNAEAQIEALRLGQRYIELILLKKFKYDGYYINRLAIAGENPFEKVPWAKGVCQMESTN